jgi:predicted enzyme related to lactoylglutathione lyase
MSAPIVFFDIAGPDETALRKFYAEVFDWPLGKPGNFIPSNLSDLHGSIRQDTAEKVLYIGVTNITVKMEQIIEAGGAVDVPRFEVLGVAVLGLFLDVAGNRMGLVEMAGDQPRVP